MIAGYQREQLPRHRDLGHLEDDYRACVTILVTVGNRITYLKPSASRNS